MSEIRRGSKVFAICRCQDYFCKAHAIRVVQEMSPWPDILDTRDPDVAYRHLSGCYVGVDNYDCQSVTATALECGFSNLGDFAGKYRKRFGENPSETLKRAH